jgi:hypothetical protein
MFEKIKAAIDRILGSQKVIMASVASACNFVAVSFGANPTEGVMLIVNALFSLLIGAQILLDLRWGSPSDGTG